MLSPSRGARFPPGKRVELIDGVIYEMSPQKSPHATGILLVTRNPGEGGYQTRLILKAGDTVAPLASPGASIAVADLLP